MSNTATVLAFDFGASSGRAIRAVYDGQNLTYEEIHRFENVPIEKDGHLCWDVETLLKEIHTAIQKAGTFDSLGFDTWGVDFGLLDTDGHLLANPVHYRDARTNGKPEQAAARMPAEELYAHTGNQIMAINTLFQLLALREQDPELLQKAEHILFMPDLFAALLGAEPVCERSIASTSQMLDPRTGQWSREVLAAYGLPENRFAPIVASGTVTGTLANGAKIIAVAGHDTQCASAAMPCAEEDAEHTAFLSCGTWSLLGTELDTPILTADSCQSGLSNELGANGKINYLKNIIGLWLIQESRREYKRRGQAYSFAELEQQALAAEPLRSFIDPDAPEFVAPGDLPDRIQEFCRKTGQPVPETVGAVMRCIYESLVSGSAPCFHDVRTYWSPEACERVTGQKPDGVAANGFIHLINSGATALDGSGACVDAEGNHVMKPFWEMTDADIKACLNATDWCRADYEYFRGGGYSSHFRCKAEMPVTMLRFNIVEGIGPVLQIAEGWTADLPDEIHNTIDKRTDPTWPTTWFCPRLTGQGAFTDVYSVMANWGANHGVTVYGHVGADLITLASMLRIPVTMHNVPAEKVYRPHAWASFGTQDQQAADYAACKQYGPLYR